VFWSLDLSLHMPPATHSTVCLVVAGLCVTLAQARIHSWPSGLPSAEHGPSTHDGTFFFTNTSVALIPRQPQRFGFEPLDYTFVDVASPGAGSGRRLQQAITPTCTFSTVNGFWRVNLAPGIPRESWIEQARNTTAAAADG
jgi:hypothetical protein